MIKNPAAVSCERKNREKKMEINIFFSPHFIPSLEVKMRTNLKIPLCANLSSFFYIKEKDKQSSLSLFFAEISGAQEFLGLTFCSYPTPQRIQYNCLSKRAFCGLDQNDTVPQWKQKKKSRF